MIIATKKDKKLVTDILARAFVTNKSVNYIIREENNITQIRALMNYSFDVCHSFGQVILSNEKNACALILFPQKKRLSLKSIWLDIKLLFTAIGLSRIRIAMSRETAIKKLQPALPMTYLWFIAVSPESQHQGHGTALIKEIIQVSEMNNLPIYLETSTLENLPWYQKLGFQIYNKLELTYSLYFLNR